MEDAFKSNHWQIQTSQNLLWNEKYSKLFISKASNIFFGLNKTCSTSPGLVLYPNTFYSWRNKEETSPTWSVILSIVSHNYLLIDSALWKSGRRRHLNKKIVWFCCFAFERSFIWNKVNETIPDRLEMIKNRFYLEGSLRQGTKNLTTDTY